MRACRLRSPRSVRSVAMVRISETMPARVLILAHVRVDIALCASILRYARPELRQIGALRASIGTLDLSVIRRSRAALTPVPIQAAARAVHRLIATEPLSRWEPSITRQL